MNHGRMLRRGVTQWLFTVAGAMWFLLAEAGAIGMAARVYAQAPPLATSTSPLVFRGVTVLDVHDGHYLTNRNVAIVGNHIQSITPAARARLLKGAQVVEARGKYLIPGLWDMHIHPMSYTDRVYPVLLAYGITGTREPGTPVPLAQVLELRKEIASGRRIGPRTVVTGATLDDREVICPLCDGRPATLHAGTADEARRLVDSLRTAGADFIKVHNITPRSVYFAIAAEARRIGIPYSGHLPDSVTVLEASDNGQGALDHVGWYELRHFCSLADSGSADQCAHLASHLRRNGTWIVPYGRDGLSTVDEQRVCDLGAMFQHIWPDSIVSQLPTPEWSCKYARGSSAAGPGDSVGVWRMMDRSGIPLLLGPDAAIIFAGSYAHTPALSLYWGLASLVHNGMSPLTALQSVTTNPAQFLHATDSLGMVAAGKLADLVLLDADPLADIHHTQCVTAVVANGRYYDRAALDALLASVDIHSPPSPCQP